MEKVVETPLPSDAHTRDGKDKYLLAWGIEIMQSKDRNFGRFSDAVALVVHPEGGDSRFVIPMRTAFVKTHNTTEIKKLICQQIDEMFMGHELNDLPL